MICPLCEKGELFPVTHANGEHSWRCKWCGELLSEHYWEEKDGSLVKRDENLLIDLCIIALSGFFAALGAAAALLLLSLFV